MYTTDRTRSCLNCLRHFFTITPLLRRQIPKTRTTYSALQILLLRYLYVVKVVICISRVIFKVWIWRFVNIDSTETHDLLGAINGIIQVFICRLEVICTSTGILTVWIFVSIDSTNTHDLLHAENNIIKVFIWVKEVIP